MSEGKRVVGTARTTAWAEERYERRNAVESAIDIRKDPAFRDASWNAMAAEMRRRGVKALTDERGPQ